MRAGTTHVSLGVSNAAHPTLQQGPGKRKMQTDDKTKDGKSDRSAFCSQIKTKIVQNLLYACWENEKLTAQHQLVGIMVSPHTGRLFQIPSASQANQIKTSSTSSCLIENNLFCFNQKFHPRTKILYLKDLPGLDNTLQRGSFDKHLLPNKNILGGEPKITISSMTQIPSRVKRWPRLCQDSPIHLMRDVMIWRYLVFCTLKKVKGPRRRVNAAWKDNKNTH